MAPISQADIDFLANLEFLKGWSRDFLENGQEGKIVQRQFKRSAVIVKNSSCSRWICVIKSGSAQVLTALDGVLPSLQQPRQRRRCTQPQPRFDAFYDSSGMLAPRAAVPTAEPPYPRTPRSRIGAAAAADAAPSPLVTQQAERRRPQTGGSPPQQPVTSASRQRQQPARAAPASATATAASRADRVNRNLQTISRVLVRSDQREEDEAEADDPAAKLVPSNQLDRRYHPYDDETDLQLPEQPQFARLQTLTAGEVFGLADLFRTDQPDLSVVSNGAACLLVDKAYFVEHSPKLLLDRLRNQATHYPSRASLQRRLQERVNWEAYKQLRVRAVLRDAGRLA